MAKKVKVKGGEGGSERGDCLHGLWGDGRPCIFLKYGDEYLPFLLDVKRLLRGSFPLPPDQGLSLNEPIGGSVSRAQTPVIDSPLAICARYESPGMGKSKVDNHDLHY